MRKFIERLVLILVGLLIAVFMSEIALRIASPLPQYTEIYNSNPIRGSELKPSINYVAFNNVMEFNTKIKINSWGLRDDEIDFSKNDKKIILALGDSYTYAHEVDREKTFVEILQGKLSSTLKQDIEIVNAGVRAYGTTQQFIYYRELVKRGLKPDLVLLCIATNDIIDNLCLDNKRRPCFKIVGDTLELAKLPGFPHLSGDSTALGKKMSFKFNVSEVKSRLKFITDSRLYGLIYSKLYHLGMNHPRIISFLNSIGFDLKPIRVPLTIQGWYTEQTSYGWNLTKKIIMKFNKEVKHNGGQLALVLIPHSLQYSQKKQKLLKSTLDVPEVADFINDPKIPQKLFTTFSQDNNIPIIDLLPVFESTFEHYNDEASPFTFSFDGHLNPVGHKLVADIVYNQMLESETILGVLKE